MKVKYYDLQNKKVFITVGGSGIGASIVEHFCEQGSEVYFVDKNGVKDFGTMGKPSLKKEEMVSWWMPKIFNLGITAEEFYIVVHMSNFIYGKGGLWMPPKLGPTRIIHEDFQFSLIRDFFIIVICSSKHCITSRYL